MNIQATLSLRATAKFLAVAIFLLLAVAAATALLNRTVWLSSLPSEVKSITSDIYREFSVDEEQNIPTWYSSNTLLVCAILLGLIATHKSQTQDRYRWHWAALAVIFGLLALDEFVSFHEEMNKILKLFISFQGLFYFGWVILALPAVSVLAIVYLKWWRNLPKRSRLLMMVATFYIWVGRSAWKCWEAMPLTGMGRPIDYMLFSLTSKSSAKCRVWQLLSMRC